jgi:flavin-binding protein dodecin
MTGSNLESWVTAVRAKLANIGVTTSQMAVAEVHSINSKLVRVATQTYLTYL